jgi:hypothetical protein
MAENPLNAATRDWLPQSDFGIMSHGFAPHGRDYIFVLEVSRVGTFELSLTHVVELHYETRVRDDVWPCSWDDVMTNYADWIGASEPEGYVWGSNWSLAYPGLHIDDADETAAQWTKRLGKQMHTMAVETDRFRLSIVFHDARAKKLSDDAQVVERVLIPLS